jgi:hypothetical protein
MTDSGQIFVSAIPDADAEDVEVLKALNAPHEILVVNADALVVGEDETSVEAAVQVIYDQLVRDAIIPDYSI